MSESWVDKLIRRYIKDMSIRERVQMIQKIAELSVQELLILEAESKEKSP